MSYMRSTAMSAIAKKKTLKIDKEVLSGFSDNESSTGIPMSTYSYKHSEDTRDKIRKARTGKIHVHKDNISKVIDPAELDTYLANGFKRGRAAYSQKAISNIRNSRKRFFERNPHWSNDTTWRKGNVPWNKGVPMKETTKEKMIKSKTGMKLTQEGRTLKKQKEIETRVKNSGSLETSYKQACEKRRETLSEHILQDPAYMEKVVEKRNNTKRKNNTFRGSKDEEEFYNLLLQKFKKEDIERQYSDERYPFPCDFYIKSLDLFIELNLFWVHGGHPFNPLDEEDCLQLEKIKSKKKIYINSKGKEHKNSYYMAEVTWAVRDPLKLKTALINKLNYTAIYTKGEMYDFITRI